jgi:hypothetical protein
MRMFILKMDVVRVERGFAGTVDENGACADQSSVKRDLLHGQKRPTICGLLRACPRIFLLLLADFLLLLEQEETPVFICVLDVGGDRMHQTPLNPLSMGLGPQSS